MEHSGVQSGRTPMVSVHPRSIKVRAKVKPKGKLICDAWKHSRPNDKPQNWETVAAIDVPVNEMEDFILEMFVPIIIRELVFTLRDHVAWARTSRVDNLNDWPIFGDSLERNRAEYKALAVRMATMMQSGIQDDFRMCLPLAYMTHFTLKISARSLVKLTQAVADLALATHGVTRIMMEDFYEALMDCMTGTPYKKLASDKKYQPLELVPKEWEPFHEPSAVVLGGMIAMRIPFVPIALRAQLVRHRPISIRDNLHYKLNDGDLYQPISTHVDVELAMTVQQAISLVKKRNCWISQDDLWFPVLNTINHALGRNNAALILPCNGCNHCPIARDNVLRYQEQDPAPPCPIWLAMEKKTYISDEQTANARIFAERRSNHLWWRTQIAEVDPQNA